MRTFLLGIATLLAAATPAAADDRVVSTIARPTTVDAYDGRAVWSAWDPEIARYRLTEYAGGRVRTLPVAPRRTPFDVDLGPGPDGAPLAVYSRCRRAPASTWALNGRRGCDVHAYSFRSGRERPVGRVNSRADEYWPAVWNGRIAFTRTYPGARRLLYWRRFEGRTPSQRLDRGPAGRGGVLEQVDMRNRRVAFVRTYEYGADLRLATTSGHGRRLVPVPGSGAAVNQLAAQGPSLAGDGVWWMLAVGGDAPVYSEIRRAGPGRAIRARRPVEADSSLPRATAGFARSRGVAWYVRAAGPEAYEVHRATGLAYEPAPPIELD